jgi:hypothetical protein
MGAKSKGVATGQQTLACQKYTKKYWNLQMTTDGICGRRAFGVGSVTVQSVQCACVTVQLNCFLCEHKRSTQLVYVYQTILRMKNKDDLSCNPL